MFNVFVQMVHALFQGIEVGITSFLSVLPIYDELSSVKEQLIAAFFGVPVIVISVVLFVISVIRFLNKKLK